jgi:hypothetical protein
MASADPIGPPPRRARARVRRLWLVLLIGCLTGVLAYLTIHDATSSSRSAGRCPRDLIPEVARVPPGQLSMLRASVARVLPGRVGRLYEEGPVLASNAFSDDSPLSPSVSPSALRPAGYEMRWWSPNRDDIVADVFVFSGSAAAQRFMEQAISTRCRSSAAQAQARRPVQAANLVWVNPDGYTQADLYMARGDRVYRVADVPEAARLTKLAPGRLRRAFYTVDTLACLIPAAGCGLADRAAPA